MEKRWTEKEIEFLKKNYKEMFYEEIGKKLGRSYKAIKAKATKFKLYKRTIKVWSDVELIYLKNNYTIMPPIKIAKYLNRTYGSVIVKARRLGLRTGYKYRKPMYDEDFFDVSNWNHELAYIVGIVLSDGHVSSSNAYCLVELGMCDEDVIEKIKNITSYGRDILEYKYGSHKNRYIINFSGKKVWNFFTSLGMDNDKSHTAILPLIPGIYLADLIRGLFDGDGSISTNKNYYPVASIAGTESVVRSVADNAGVYYNIYSHSMSKTTFVISYTGKRALQFLEYIYKDSTPNTRMDRKYNKYLNALKFWKGANK